MHYYHPSDTDCIDVTELLLDAPIDVEGLLEDLRALNVNEFTQKDFSGWTSLPLRSVGGETGKHASDATGIHASNDASLFADTKLMEATPHIRKLVQSLRGDHKLLKIRLMKLIAGRSIGEHRDRFSGEGVYRLHVPIVTHRRVRFLSHQQPHHMPVGRLYYLDVYQPHAVVNKSPIDRVHLVFDIVTHCPKHPLVKLLASKKTERNRGPWWKKQLRRG